MRARRKQALLAVVATGAIVAGSVVLGERAGGQSAPWPDSQVAAVWPAFSSIPHAESGAGGLRSWQGSFSHCVPSPRVDLDYACEYGDEEGNVGYVCLAPSGRGASISPAAIDALVAPRDPTYESEPPTRVCYSARAYSLSLG
jgi:hypothetical protein